jgi:hypothetical protein
MTLSLDELYEIWTADDCLQAALDAAEAMGLDTTAWQTGGPERTLNAVWSHVLATRDGAGLQFNKGGLLRHARGAMLTMLALDQYGVERPVSTYASAANGLTITNSGGGAWPVAVGDIIVEASSTEKRYKNSNAGNIAAGPAVDSLFDLVAEEAGTASNAAPGEIDTLVTTYLGCTCTNAVALVGTDGASDDELVELCTLSLGVVSPNGAQAAYEYIARSTLRTDGSTVDVNRVRATGDKTAGTTSVVLASSSGVPAGGDVTLVDDAIQTTVVSLTETCTVAAATGATVVVTYTLYVPDDCLATDDEIEAAVADGLAGWFSRYPIGGRTTTPGGAGYLFADALRARITAAATYAAMQAAATNDPDATATEVLTRATQYDAFTCTLTLPAADVALGATEVAVLDAITPTITRVAQ